MIASYFNFSSVTTNNYSVLNQIQWSQTLTSISNELVSDDSESTKINKIQEFVSPLEDLGSMIHIECNSTVLYSSSQDTDIIKEANAITPINTTQNTNYFGEDGLVIVNHAQKDSKRYLLIIVNKNYIVNDTTNTLTNKTVSSLLLSKTGLLIIMIALLFIISIVVLSFITSKTISKPINKLAKGADEIANGNLDYVIDYESTNEIGTTVKSFNAMTKQLKESLNEQKRIEESRKEMIAGVAHDLRTPLTSVKGYVEGLMDGIADTPEKQKRYLEIIYSSALDTEKMLDELLTISRLELGQIQLNTQVINLNDLLNDCCEDLKLSLEKANFDFVYTNNHKDEKLLVDLDTDRFSRVIGNIISNSMKYAKKDVKGKIELAVDSYEKSVIISISDNGIGLDSKDLGRIFESFYRADKARSQVRNGSGIGLSVCKQIIELHGGHIWATGKEGEGLTINISLERKVEGSNEEDINN
jgi:signal transduction histidine kinase